MKLLVTGAKGFVGRNLVTQLENIRDGKEKGTSLDPEFQLYEYDVDTSEELLDEYTKDCDFVFHLAGVNRPKVNEEFMEGNYGFTAQLIDKLKAHKNTAPILITSSIQANLDNPYGKSKKAGEEALFEYSRETGAPVFVYQLPNVFGKWCRPNYNSAIATFCYNISHGIDITINDPSVLMQLVYIDDVVDEFIKALKGEGHVENGYGFIPTVHRVPLGEIVQLIQSFKDSRENLSIPYMGNAFEKALYSTYLSYLPEDSFSYPLRMNVDDRGSFTEILRSKDRGQFSVNVSNPHITKGNHWHRTKNEKFVVVSGKALIQFRKIGTEEVIEYHVSGEKIEVVDIPVGYTHTIINEGETELITFMWCNECFDPSNPDTFYEEI